MNLPTRRVETVKIFNRPAKFVGWRVDDLLEFSNLAIGGFVKNITLNLPNLTHAHTYKYVYVLWKRMYVHIRLFDWFYKKSHFHLSSGNLRLLLFNLMITFPLRVCLGSAYFTKIENFFLKILQIKVKVNWNSIVRLMNNTKKCSNVHK